MSADKDRYLWASRAALTHWEPAAAVTMVAIGAAESGEFMAFDGDPLDSFRQQLNEGKITQATFNTYARCACNGYCSFSVWQIFAGAHYQMLTRLSGSESPCDWRAWLLDFDHCAVAAKEVYDGQGFNAWSTYWKGDYREYLPMAAQSVLEAAQTPAPPAPPVDPRLLLTPAQRERYDDLEAYLLVQKAVLAGDLHFVPVQEGKASVTVEARYERTKPGPSFVVKK